MAAISAPVQIPLASDPGKSSLASSERLINCFPEAVGQGENAKIVLYGSPGYTEFATVIDGACRGILSVDGTPYLINDNTISYLASDGTRTNVGFIEGFDPVIMCYNANLGGIGRQLCIVCDFGTYIATSTSCGLISDPSLPTTGAVACEWIDGYFVIAFDDGTFYISGINNATIDALDFATAEANPDGLVMVKRLRQELYFFGNKTIEVWANTGAAAFPFERLPGAVIASGCSSKHTVQEVGDRLYWLDEDGVVQRLAGGYTCEPVANRGVFDAVRGVIDKTEIRAFTYTVGNRNFYVLTHEDFTWVFDTSNNLWHERRSKTLDCWVPVASAFCYGKTLFGSREDGRVYAFDEDAFSENGNEIQVIARFPKIDSFPQGGALHELIFDIETGVGVAASSEPDTVDPQMTLRWSRDGAKTFTGGRLLSLGEQGEYRKRIKTARLGSFKDKGLVLQVEASSKVFRTLFGVSALIEPLAY